MLAGYCAFLQLYATQPLLPMLRGVFHAGEVEVSLTVTMASLGVAISAPFAGMLADRIGRRPVIVWSAFLLALTALATATADHASASSSCGDFFKASSLPESSPSPSRTSTTNGAPSAAGRAVAAYISGTVLGGFSSRMISGLVAAHAPSGRSGVSGAGRVEPGSGGGDRRLASTRKAARANRSTTGAKDAQARAGAPSPHTWGTANCWRRSWSASACCFRWWASSPT